MVSVEIDIADIVLLGFILTELVTEWFGYKQFLLLQTRKVMSSYKCAEFHILKNYQLTLWSVLPANVF